MPKPDSSPAPVPSVAVLTLDDVRRAAAEAVRAEMLAVMPEAVRRAMLPATLTGPEVERLAGFSARKLQRLRDARTIPFMQDGRSIVYPTSDLLAWLDERRVSLRWDDAASTSSTRRAA